MSNSEKRRRIERLERQRRDRAITGGPEDDGASHPHWQTPEGREVADRYRRIKEKNAADHKPIRHTGEGRRAVNDALMMRVHGNLHGPPGS